MARTLRTRTAALAAALVVGLGACSWGPEEPGLFTTPRPTPTAAASSAVASPPAPTNPRLPVLGDALWTTADGSGVTVRLAVHALRQTVDATVLDWSVTPLAAAGRRAGELVPSGTDLGLERDLAAEQNIALLDLRTRRAFRPLANVSPSRFHRCLCTPLFAATPQLRFGDTKLLQLAFPRLPLGTSRVDVAFPNVAVVPGVPLTPVGAAPVADEPSDLTRPAGSATPVSDVATYTSPDRARRQQTVVVDRVVATGRLTSVVWTLHSVDDQGGMGASAGPPVSQPLPGTVRVATATPASGPRLRVPGRRGQPVGVRWTTATFAGRPAYECLCSALGLWSRGLRSGGGTAHLTTHVGPLPRGTKQVDVLFPGLPALRDVPVTRVIDVAGRVRGVEPGTDATWRYEESDPPLGWSTQDWPTPLPAPGAVADYAGGPERVLDALPDS